MNGKEFVDTNVLVYAFDRTAGVKRNIAAELIGRLWTDHTGCLSLQVLQEFYVTVTRKLNMPAADAARQVDRFGLWQVHRPAFEDLVAAIDLHHKKQISFWDAMMLRSAMQSGCSVVWTEDLSDGQKWESLLVRNPFSAASR